MIKLTDSQVPIVRWCARAAYVLLASAALIDLARVVAHWGAR